MKIGASVPIREKITSFRRHVDAFEEVPGLTGGYEVPGTEQLALQLARRHREGSTRIDRDEWLGKILPVKHRPLGRRAHGEKFGEKR